MFHKPYEMSLVRGSLDVTWHVHEWASDKSPKQQAQPQPRAIDLHTLLRHEHGLERNLVGSVTIRISLPVQEHVDSVLEDRSAL